MSKIADIVKRLKSILRNRVVHKPQTISLGDSGKQITLYPVLHNLQNDSIKESLTSGSMVSHKDTVLFVEGSLYLGGFLPENVNRENIRVLLEAPSLFYDFDKTRSLLAMYLEGRDIPESARGLRRMFEAIAGEIQATDHHLDIAQLTNELLYLRRNYSEVVVYNEPAAWLRTVWYESDLLFYYLTKRVETRLFGVLLYSDMDEAFVDFIAKHAKAINAMTGQYCLLFAFDGKLEKREDLYTNSQYITYKAIVERLDRFDGKNGGPKTAAELDALREEETAILADTNDLNRSLLFADKLGVRRKETPCIAFWESLESEDILVLSFAEFQSNGEIMKDAFKMMADIIKHETLHNDTPLIPRLKTRFEELKYEPKLSHTQAPANMGSLTLEFLKTVATKEIKIDISTAEVVMGDKFENIHNATIVNRSMVENAFNKLKNEFDEETAHALKQVASEIEKSANKEAVENFNSFTEELQKAEPRKSILRTLWSGVTTALPPILQMTDVVTKISKLFIN